MNRGVEQLSGKHLYIKSFEMGVMFAPSLLSYRKHIIFSNTPHHPILGSNYDEVNFGDVTFFAGLQPSSNLNHVMFPIPFAVPSSIYNQTDKPWIWNKKYTARDFCGNVWP